MLGPKEYRSPRTSKQLKKKPETDSGIGSGVGNVVVSAGLFAETNENEKQPNNTPNNLQMNPAGQYRNINLGNGNSDTAPNTNTIVRTAPRQSNRIDPEDNLDAVMRGINQRRQRREDDYIKANGPRIRYNSLGQVIDGGWTKDKVLRRWGIFAFHSVQPSHIWCCIFVADNIVGDSMGNVLHPFLERYFGFLKIYENVELCHVIAGDAYHHAGLFQVCGTADIQFNPQYSDSGGAGNLTIKANSSHPLTCVSVEEYISNFMALVQPNTSNPQPSDRFYNAAQGSLGHIETSRWLEGVGTFLDMVFGTCSLLLVLRPAADERIEARNAGVTFFGIFVMPWFPVFDILISFSYWSELGVGYFAPLSYGSSDSLSNYTLAGPVVSIFTSWFDFTVQILFLAWGLKRLLGANKKQLKHLFITKFDDDGNGVDQAGQRNDQVQVIASSSEVGVVKVNGRNKKGNKQEKLFPGPKALGI
ncbi:hypothetical protein HK100_004027 [Physocladia obscura]|uniref:Uncharacterized protein n=1 Tax=Physocladia obscura TaxID=109957 RepID=A0AAD5SUX5_9FUNG|nr:hypothetical protein HK100_004027 [Physocladia obscura]